MKKSNLYIFTEGGDGIGLGHIIRCSALYEKALDYNLEPKFIVFGKNIDKTLKKYNCEIREWKDINYLSTLITKEDFVIIDSYLAKIEIYETISKLSKKALYIDDNTRLEYPSGIVVNPSLYGDEIDYLLKDGIEYLLGKNYIILRKEFEETQKNKTNRKNEGIKKILITLGGTDMKNLSPKLLQVLKNINLDFSINIVVSESYENILEILKEKTKKTKILKNLSATEMQDLMINSDIVISACGQTVHELLYLKKLFFSIVTAENQINTANKLIKLGFNDYVCKDYRIFQKKLELFIRERYLAFPSIEINNGVDRIIHCLLKEEQ